MQRVIKGRSATITYTWMPDGVPTDPTPASTTIEIVRADGTVLVSAGTATTRTGTGAFAYTLTPTHTAQLDTLTARWTATFDGQAQTAEVVVEIAGGFLFELAQARQYRPLNDTTTYPTNRLIEERTRSESALEDACGVAFVPRYARETIDHRGGVRLLLSRPRIRAIRSVTVDGRALSSAEIGQLDFTSAGEVYGAAPTVFRPAPITIGYEHGHSSPPPRPARVAILIARSWLVESPVDDRTSRVNSEGGTIQFLTAEDGPFDIPEANAVVREYGYATGYA